MGSRDPYSNQISRRQVTPPFNLFMAAIGHLVYQGLDDLVGPLPEGGELHLGDGMAGALGGAVRRPLRQRPAEAGEARLPDVGAGVALLGLGQDAV